jgi:hypothetical protein
VAELRGWESLPQQVAQREELPEAPGAGLPVMSLAVLCPRPFVDSPLRSEYVFRIDSLLSFVSYSNPSRETKRDFS